jgi:hypothetical protein
MYVLASLDPKKIEVLRDFEEKEGVKVLAFSDVAIVPAKVDEKKLKDMRGLEERLGVTLVALS